MNRVYVVGGDAGIEQMFALKGWEVVKDHSVSADLVCFTGGADVSPEYYGERNFASYTNPPRDVGEKKTYESVLKTGLPMVGICRGGQFLNVMNGGRMYQHVTRHGIHGTHPITDLDTGTTIEVTSTHHQMMIPNYDKAEVIAIANLGGEKHTLKDDEPVIEQNDNDTEVVYYEDTNSLCFQPHPEYGYKSCERYFFDLLNSKFGL